MSTYYYFKCEKCKRTGGFLSRQAWGWGNFDIIDSFKFLGLHIAECGHDNIRMTWEHDDDCYNEEPKDSFLKRSEGIFPYSNDWEFMKKTEKDYDKAWIENENAPPK